MLDGIAWKAESDDLMDRPAQSILFDIRESIGQIGPQLPAKTVLGSEYEFSLKPVLVKG
jgi:hypothetical protein